MNKVGFKNTIIINIVVFIVLVFLLGLTHYYESRYAILSYDLLSKLSGFVLAFSGAWLARAFQKYMFYQKQVRDLYMTLNRAIQETIQYTHQPTPRYESFSKVNLLLSQTTDEARTVFLNLRESEENIGFYPFQSWKEIQRILGYIGYEKEWPEYNRRLFRSEIIRLWRIVRNSLLVELERTRPIKHDSPYVS